MYDTVIIGAGPAGLTAALYAGRFRLDSLVLEKMAAGGQIILSSTIENYPGFPGGIPTQELIDKFKKQVEDVNVGILSEEVREVTLASGSASPVYNIKTAENTYAARSVIVASGAHYKKLRVKGEEGLVGRGVSYCGTCDGPLFRNKDIVVVGGGDRAIEEAIFLSTYASKVTLIHRRDALRASRILQEKAQNNPKINFLLGTVAEEIIGQNKVERIRVRNLKADSLSEVVCQGVFIFVGIIPDTDFVKNLLKRDESGFIITDQNMAASREGVFACGDCREKGLYQVVNATGEGAVAADSAHKYLLTKGR